MPFRRNFDCLWCGSPHVARGPDDLEGWSQLCPECLGRAGENGFLRMRLKAALAERASAGASAAAPTGRTGAPDAGASPGRSRPESTRTPS